MSIKLCIAGKNQIAVDVLAAATRLLPDVTILCLPTSVDRGFEGWQPSLFAAAERANIPIVSLESLYDEPDLVFLSVEYDRIIRPDRFRQPDRLFNLHFSLLPAYRGCNTSIWPILNGEERHGVTLHRIDPGIDTGEIIATRDFVVGTKTARDLYFQCMALGRELCIEYLPKLLRRDFTSHPQDHDAGSSYRRRDLDFSRRVINFDQPTTKVLQQVRAFTFPEYQLPLVDGRSILDARAVDAQADRDEGDRIIRLTADGAVELRVTNTPPPPVALQQSGY